MAEAIVAPTSLDRFYCHSCTKEITPDLPNYTCPQCADGFVEQISEEESVPPSPEENADLHTIMAVRNIMEQLIGPSLVAVGGSLDNISDRGSTITFSSQHAPGRRPHQFLEGFRLPNMMQLIAQDRQGGGLGGMFHLHGSPGDYAWGPNGFDSIISQLLNQLEGSGAPPAPEEKIENLPVVKISQDQFDKNVQCSVCFEDYAVDEEVLKLPCDHLYHPQCITPWLKLHGTCPICRKDLNGEEVTIKENEDSF